MIFLLQDTLNRHQIGIDTMKSVHLSCSSEKTKIFITLDHVWGSSSIFIAKIIVYLISGCKVLNWRLEVY